MDTRKVKSVGGFVMVFMDQFDTLVLSVFAFSKNFMHMLKWKLSGHNDTFKFVIIANFT